MPARIEIPGLTRHARALGVSHTQLRGVIKGTRKDPHGIAEKYRQLLAEEEELEKAEGAKFKGGEEFSLVNSKLTPEQNEALAALTRQEGVVFVVTRPFSLQPLAGPTS